MRFRWVTASDLDQWAETIASRTEVIDLVGDLIRATVVLGHYCFPRGDFAQLPGYDGLLEAAEGSFHLVPGGLSVWEAGTSRDSERKATKDFNDRSESPGEVDPLLTTYVALTPRVWQDKAAWAARMKAEGTWRAIRTIDGVDLEHWLDESPAVAAEFASRLGKKPADGVQSADDFWTAYAASANPQIGEELLLAGRGEQTDQLRRLLRDTSGRKIIIRADSQEEALAFAVAAVRTADPEFASFVHSRLLVVDRPDLARQLHGFGPLVIALRSFDQTVSSAFMPGHLIIVPLGNDAPMQAADITLDRPSLAVFAAALGTMGVDPVQAAEMSWECGRSVTILRRRRPGSPVSSPIWLVHAEVNALLPAVLAGGWDASREVDRAILAELAGKTYEQMEELLSPFLQVQDAPLERFASIWMLRAPVDAFELLARRVTQHHLGRLREVAVKVFRELDPALELPPDERLYAALHHHEQSHSAYLRAGLANTLRLVAVRGESSSLITGAGSQAFADDIVRSLTATGFDHRLLASLAQQLMVLMETAPSPLLAAIDGLVHGEPSAVAGIFSESNVFGSPSSPHTYLLWALELVAWDPGHFGRAVMILGRLARLDPGGRLANRPLNSLRAIFLPWWPSTNAPPDARLRVLDKLLVREPAVGWQLLLSLLPTPGDTAFPTYRPQWRDFGASERQDPQQAQAEGGDAIIRRMLDLLGQDAERWASIFKRLGQVAATHRSRLFELLERYSAGEIPHLQRLMVWEAARDELSRHRSAPAAPWSLPPDEVRRLGAIVDQLRPDDAVRRHSWLFDNPHPAAMRGLDQEQIESQRIDALRAILAGAGITGILRLASTVALPELVGAVASVAFPTPILDSLLEQTTPSDTSAAALATGLSAHAARIHGETWRRHVIAWIRAQGWEPERAVLLLQGWPDDPGAWRDVASLGPEVERLYWSKKPAWLLLPGLPGADHAARKYLEVGRPLEAVDALAYHFATLASELVLPLLDAALAEIREGPASPRQWPRHMNEVFTQLRQRTDLAAADLGRREFLWLPFLDHHRESLTLHQLLADDPGLFVEVLCAIYKPHSQTATEISEAARNLALAGFRVLQSWRTVPGRAADESVDAAALKSWVLRARTLAAEHDREAVADGHIGKILAYTPPDPLDGAWPIRAVRELLEEIDSSAIEASIVAEQMNKRGVYHKVLHEGGDQERQLAEQAAQWARAASGWPRTRRVLEEIRDAWQREANREDREAEVDQKNS
jgi:hypothetical protein